MDSPDRTRRLLEAFARWMPAGGLFADQYWRPPARPFPLSPSLVRELETLGRVLLQFYRVASLLYRQSAEGRQPEWIARWLELGKPAELIQLQRHRRFRQELPRVIRPDLLVTEEGFALTELDSVPGGIGLTDWLHHLFASAEPETASRLVGGPDGMRQGFAGIFGKAPRVHILVSEESAAYRPEMEWLAGRLGQRFAVRGEEFNNPAPGDAVYRFFELFDVENVPSARKLFERAAAGEIQLTPPPVPVLEEKLWLALLWNGRLEGWWRRELGAAFFERLRRLVPRTWVLDPAPIPPHAGIPGLDLTDWEQLKGLSQKRRRLILKPSGFSPEAWGARGVYLGSDLSLEAWSRAVERALAGFPQGAWILQAYRKPMRLPAEWIDPDTRELRRMEGRVRLCPYYFVHGEGPAARTQLGGVLATICPADKKIIHGMSEAILAPCIAED